MTPQTPSKSHTSRIPTYSTPGTPSTPPSGYVLAQEETPTRATERGSHTEELQLRRHEPEPPSSSTSGSGSRSTLNEESMLEVLEADETGSAEGDDEVTRGEGDEEGGFEEGEPLVSRGRRRGRRRWEEEEEEEEKKERSLIELVPPLILAHPLPLLPLLALLPYVFLPAGVVFFIPILCILAILSSCAHIVIVYLAWYLKVPTFERVFASVTGRYGRQGLWAGRAAVMVSTTGLLVGWIGTLHQQLLAKAVILSHPMDHSPHNDARMTRSLRRAPIFLVLLLPIVVFLVIGRTVEIEKALKGVVLPEAKRRAGLPGGSSAGAGLTTLTVFLSPHINTLPIHSSLSRERRSSFPIPCLATSTTILVLSLPFALVPYYLLPSLLDPLPTATSTTPSGVFAELPADDAWVNVARVVMCVIVLGSSNMWILRARDTILRAMGVERGERQKAGRWVGLGLWVVVVSIACVGDWVADTVELLGVIATIAVGWFLPSLFFIITFHVRSPLAIVFPSTASKPDQDGEEPPPAPARTLRQAGSQADSLSDPSTDALLARKERQLQKRRLGRRLWQDLIVYVGILPVGCVTLAWTLGALVGVW